jgi:thiol-disulfide isomerase/thioredoxin
LIFISLIELVWHYIETVITKPTVRKKGLKQGVNYYFAVRPVDGHDEYEYSLSSAALHVAVTSEFMTNNLPHSLMSPTGMISLSDAVAGKVVGIYFSAHWCGPCRQFTPMLAAVYQQAKVAGKAFEIIFCSADHGDRDFEEYYLEMPWLAIPYGEDQRESLMGSFRVSGIPKLSILAPSGQVLLDNAAGQRISLEMIDSWIATAHL